jgi:hypothetical protein
LNDAVATFVVDRNVDNFANALVKATKEHQSTKQVIESADLDH